MGSEERYRPGHPPHDVIAGLRVGAFVGGLAGLLIIWALGIPSIWIVLACAAIGGTYGYLSERRHTRE